MRQTRNVYLAVLRKDLPSPLAKESDEEKGAAATKPEDTEAAAEGGSEGSRAEARLDGSAARRRTDRGGRAERSPRLRRRGRFRIDFDDIQYRILDMPIPAGDISNLQAGTAGQLYFLRRADGKTVAAALRPREARRSSRWSTPTDYVRLRRRQEAALRAAEQLVHRRRPRRASSRTPASWRPTPSRSSRSARRVEADLQRSLAHQPRLLLRPDDARRRTGRRSATKYAPLLDARGDARRPEPRDAVDVERAGRRPSPRRRRRFAGRAADAFRAACSAPTTRSRTAAIGSRRSTAG